MEKTKLIKRRQVAFNINDELYTEYKKLMLDYHTTPTANITAHIKSEVDSASLRKKAMECYEQHKEAFENWTEGNISNAWVDDDGNICIAYDNGKWWHYNGFGEWW